jgi:hypothetical protein
MLSDTYAAALGGPADPVPGSEKSDAEPVSPPDTLPETESKAGAEDEDLETARTRPLPFDTINL